MPFTSENQPANRGRKPKRSHKGAVAAAEKQIRDRLPEVLDALIQSALGVTVQDGEDDLGAPQVYLKAPDVKAGIYLTDRVLGKPVAAVELSGPDGGAIEVHDRTLTDEERATRIAAILDRVRARAAGSAESAGADLDAAAGTADRGLAE